MAVIVFLLTMSCFFVLGCFALLGSLGGQISASASRLEKAEYGYVQGTGSMLPTIKADSKLYYERNFTIKVGDIYVYRIPETDSRIVHRLLYQEGEWCYFMGDNNLYMDQKVNCSNIVQKVVAIEYK